MAHPLSLIEVYDATIMASSPRFFLRPDGRTYTILPAVQDLLGDWVVVTTHGSIASRQGGLKTYVATGEGDAQRVAERMARLRVRHGYLEIP